MSDATNTAPKTRRYAGTDVVVMERVGRCIHSRNCVLGRPDVFVPNAPGDWILPDAAGPETVIALTRNCPSGALSAETPDGRSLDTLPAVNTVRVRENGPLEFSAELTLAGQKPASVGLRTTLCRCGASNNKPYCDGGHVAAAFIATGEPATRQSEPLSRRDGPLKVLPAPDGPLVIEGTGRTVLRTQQIALCPLRRLGQQTVREGSHVRVGLRFEVG